MSPNFRKALLVIASCFALLAAFTAGTAFGMRKARHFDRWVDNYPMMFEPRDRIMFHVPPVPGMLPSGYGVFGRVVSVSEPTFVVEGRDGVEQEVLNMPGKTFIRVGRGEGTFVDIQPDIEAAVFGAPNESGQIEAKLIRILDGFPR